MTPAGNSPGERDSGPLNSPGPARFPLEARLSPAPFPAKARRDRRVGKKAAPRTAQAVGGNDIKAIIYIHTTPPRRGRRGGKDVRPQPDATHRNPGSAPQGRGG